MTAPLVVIEQMNHSIVKLTLNRPVAANALSRAMIVALSDALDAVNAQSGIRCVILTGAGEKAFCAGADLKERLAMTDEEVPQAVAKIGALTSKIAAMPMPVVVALNGVAFGGGLEIALACDIRIASDTIQVGLTETGLGIIPGAGGTQRLPRLVGEGHAKSMILRAKRLSAKEAYRIGLVQEICPADELVAKTDEISREIARNAPIAVSQAKQAITNGMQVPLDEGLKIETICYTATIETSDRLEGLRAFQEKRQPVYEGK